jgi:signal transduction histidine kinase
MLAGEMKFEVEEFKNKMMPIVSDKNVLSESVKYFHTLSESLADHVKRTSAIIKGIINYARVEANETHYKEFELKEVIELSIDLLKVKHNIKSEAPVDYSQVGNKTVFGIKSLLMESVYNIVDNGYEAAVEMNNYAYKHGHGMEYKPKITVALNDSPDSSEIIIADNGIGIKPENTKKVFAPFFTTKSSYKSGSGIGMYVVKRMISEMHKGHIRVESKYLHGTRVYISLPKSK